MPSQRTVRRAMRSGFPPRLAGLMLAVCVVMALLSQRSVAGTVSWEGGVSTAWASGTNWIGGAAPADDTTTDLAAFTFAASPAHAPNAGIRSIAGIAIGDGTTSVPGFTISGTSLTIGGSGVEKLAASAATTIASPIVLATDQTWTNASTTTLTVSGSVDAGDAEWIVAGAGDTTVSGVLSGTGQLTKQGAGRLRLQGNNTFSGAVTITSGTVELAGNTALADGVAVTLANDATAVLRVAAAETIGSLAGGGGAGGTVMIDAALTVGAANTSTSFGGWLDGGSAFIKTGTGILTLTNTTTNDAYTGRVDVFGGSVSISAVESLGKRGTTRELHLSNGATLQTTADMSFNTRIFQLFTADEGGIAGRFDVAAGTTTVLKGNIQGLAGSGGLLKTGSGTLVFGTGAVQYKNYQGVTSVVAGTLVVDAQLRESPSLFVAAGAVLSGTGRIDRAVTTIAGTHAPGRSPGIQQFGVNDADVGNLSYQAGSSVVWELITNSTASRGTNYDGIDLVGTTSSLAFGGTTSLVLSFTGTSLDSVDWTASFWQSDRSWLLYDVAGSTSGVSNLAVLAEDWLDGSGQRFNTELPGATFSIRQVGQDVELVYAVPEPASLSLVVAGLGMLATRSLGRRKPRRGTETVPGDRLGGDVAVGRTAGTSRGDAGGSAC